jgi:hypothetical protein
LKEEKSKNHQMIPERRAVMNHIPTQQPEKYQNHIHQIYQSRGHTFYKDTCHMRLGVLCV